MREYLLGMFRKRACAECSSWCVISGIDLEESIEDFHDGFLQSISPLSHIEVERYRNLYRYLMLPLFN